MANKEKVTKNKKTNSSTLSARDKHTLQVTCAMKELAELKHEYAKVEHEWTMEELEYRRQSDKIHHEHECERQRIKSAEIRKTQERKEAARFARSYSKDLGY